MYEEPDGRALQTGDIFHLGLDQFKKLVRHDEILPLLEAYENNPFYASHFWVILNQPCNMVHDTQKGRHFTGNLFIAPLQGFRSALKRGILGDLLHVEAQRKARNILLDRYKDYLLNKLRAKGPKAPDQDAASYSFRSSARPTSW